VGYSQPVDRGFPQTAWFVENSGVGVSQRHSRFDLRKLNPYLLCAYVGIRPCRGAEKPDLRPWLAPHSARRSGRAGDVPARPRSSRNTRTAARSAGSRRMYFRNAPGV